MEQGTTLEADRVGARRANVHFAHNVDSLALGFPVDIPGKPAFRGRAGPPATAPIRTSGMLQRPHSEGTQQRRVITGHVGNVRDCPR